MEGLGVLIMAAGKGTRMRSARPKALQPMMGLPMLDWLLRAVAACGEACETAVLVGSGGEELAAWLSGSPVTVLWQREQLGTGHAVQSARGWWERLDALAVINGDMPLLRPEALASLIGRFQDEGLDCVLGTSIADDPTGYGRVIRGEGGARVVEHRDATEEERAVREVNAGCYVFRTAALARVIDRIGADNAQGERYLPDVLALMSGEGMRVEAHVLPTEDAFGVNDQLELARAASAMRDRILRGWMERGVRVMDPASTWVGPDVELAPDVTLWPGAQLWGRTRIGEGSTIGTGCVLTDAELGRRVALGPYTVVEGSELRDHVSAGPFAYIREGCLLQEHAFAGKFVELKKTTVGRDSKVPHLSYMGDATLGAGVNIGAGTITCNYDGRDKHPTIIGDGCFVGSDTMLVAPAELGAGATTAAGSVITSTVPAGALGVGRARQRNIEGWSLRKGRTGR